MADSSVQSSGVAERYANALFELAGDQNRTEAVEKDLDAFSGLLAESPDLVRLVRSPVFSSDEQLRAVSAILAQAGIGGLVGNLVKVAASNRRLFAVPAMIAAYKRLAAKQRGEVSAEITSAAPLTDGQTAELKAALSASLGKNVTLVPQVDATLIGGLIVKVGSRMIDGSLRTKLNSLKLAMKEVG